MTQDENKSARYASPEKIRQEIRREVFLMLADEPDIDFTPADDGCEWDVAVPSLDMFFTSSVSFTDWHTILLRVKACKGAIDAVRQVEQASQEA